MLSRFTHRLVVALVCLTASPLSLAQEPAPHPGRLAPATIVPSDVSGGAILSVGPGDTLYLTTFGHPDMSAQVTVGAEGDIVVPLIGSMAVSGRSPADIGRLIGSELVRRELLRDAKVSVEVVKVRSRIASVLGEVQRPGRYPIEGRLTVLELLAMAGGLKESADDKAVVLRRSPTGDQQERLELLVGNRELPTRTIDNAELQPGDVVFIAQAPRFYIYGEVARAGSYPMEPGLNVMRALSLAGGLTQRASERRIDVNRTDPKSGEIRKLRVGPNDPVLTGDVLHVDERLF